MSSITKKGEIESTSAPWVVLVINVNISLVGLILLSKYISEKFNSGVAWTRGLEPLQDAKDKGLAKALKLKTLHFYFSDPRSH